MPALISWKSRKPGSERAISFIAVCDPFRQINHKGQRDVAVVRPIWRACCSHDIIHLHESVKYARNFLHKQ